MSRVAIYITFVFLSLNPLAMSLSGNIFANTSENSSQDWFEKPQNTDLNTHIISALIVSVLITNCCIVDWLLEPSSLLKMLLSIPDLIFPLDLGVKTPKRLYTVNLAYFWLPHWIMAVDL